MQKVLEVHKLTKKYQIYNSNIDRLKELFLKKEYHKTFIANQSISFTLYEGETLGIIGINGAGKSTLLKMIAGVTVPTSGEIMRHGRVTALLELGTGFNQEMSGEENIYLNGTLIGMSKKEVSQHKKDIIDFSELGDYIHEPIKTYSSGMKMRLAFSIAIFSQPKVLIVDEALSVGDAHFSAKCTQALAQRKKQNMSIIYVSHDLNSLKLLSDRMIMLHNGKIVEQGTPENVVNRYNFLIAKLNEDSNLIKLKQESAQDFGTYEIEIKRVSIKKDATIQNNFTTGDRVTIEIEIDSTIDTDSLTIGIQIRDRYAQDIYGTNTFLQEIPLSVKADKSYLCSFSIELNIGVGKYTLVTALHTSSRHTEECYHWVNNAADFEVSMSKDKSFIGLCRLEPDINFKERTN